MSSALISTTIQAVLFSALSNVLAQGLTAVRQRSLSKVDIVPLIHFILFSMVSTPPNILWQKFLENQFPSNQPPSSQPKVKADDDGDKSEENKSTSEDEKPKLDVVNTAIKFILEQSIGSAANTIMFIAVMGFFRNGTFDGTSAAIQESLWPMMLASYNVWPIVSLLNLTVIPFEFRFLFGSIIGVIWGVYINLTSI